MRRGLPVCLKMHLGQTVVQKIHLQQGHGLAVVQDVKPAGVRKRADCGGFDMPPLSQGEKCLDVRRWHSEGHTLLGLGN